MSSPWYSMVKAHTLSNTSKTGYGIHAFKVNKQKPRSDAALTLMAKVVDQVQPLCHKYQWTVPVCEESDFSGKRILGMNVNRGQKILLRLRESEHRGGGFLQYDSVLGTMLHELSHNRHSNHSSDFYKLLDTLRDECEQLIGDGITGQRSDHQYTMHSSS